MSSTPVEQSRTYYPGLEILRGIAACLVVLHHAYDLSGRHSSSMGWLLESFGSMGVIIFFVLSAFLLSTSLLLDKQKSILNFYIRRFFRIAPAYYFMLIVVYIFFAAPSNIYSRQGFWQSIANLLFLQHFSPDTVSNLNVNGALWTLSVEALLYLILPLLVFFVTKNSWIAFALMLITGYAYRMIVRGGLLNEIYFHKSNLQANQKIYLQQQFPGWIPVFAAGIFIAVIRLRYKSTRKLQMPSWLFPVLFIPAIMVSRLIFRSSQPTSWWFTNYDLLMGLSVAVMVYVISGYSEVSGSQISKLGLYLGKRSYGIYLWHFPILLSVYGSSPQEANHVHFILWERLIVAFFVIALFGEISFKLIEIPLIAKGKLLVQRRGN